MEKSLSVIEQMIEFEKHLAITQVNHDTNTGYVPGENPYYLNPVTRQLFVQWCLGR